jgi:hypothetical protein
MEFVMTNVTLGQISEYFNFTWPIITPLILHIHPPPPLLRRAIGKISQYVFINSVLN